MKLSAFTEIYICYVKFYDEYNLYVFIFIYSWKKKQKKTENSHSVTSNKKYNTYKYIIMSILYIVPSNINIC